MSKNLACFFVFIIILIFFIYGFSASYTSHNLSNLAYVLAIGIDKGDNAKIKITTQFVKPSSSSESGSSDESSNIVLASGEADSIFSGLNLINSYIGKELNLAHCSTVVFSEEFAKDGISDEIYSLINNEEIRPSANLIISNCTAYDYISNVTPNLENLTTHYYDTFSITSKFTGYISNITIGDFFNDLSNKYNGSTAILGGLNLTARSKDSSDSESSDSQSGSDNQSKELPDSEDTKSAKVSPENLIAGTSTVSGGRGSENIGLAVFDNDKYCGDLTASESICHLLLNNKVKSCIISIDSPFAENSKMEVQITPVKNSKIRAKIDNDNLKFDIKLNLSGDIITLENDTNYENSKILEMVSESAEKYLTDEFSNYLNKVSKEYCVDIDKFTLSSLKYFPTNSDFDNFNWIEKYKNCEFNLDINVNIISSLLVTET